VPTQPFKRILLKEKEELIGLLRCSCSTIEDGVEILGGPLGTEEFPLIDLLAKEKDGRALLIFADLEPDEGALLNATAQTDWTLQNRSLLGKLFPDLCVNDSAPPRAALIYPEFPLLIKRFVRAALPSQSPLLYQFRCLEAQGERFLYLERCIPDGAVPRGGGDPSEILPRFRKGVTSEEVEITAEEREAFLFQSR